MNTFTPPGSAWGHADVAELVRSITPSVAESDERFLHSTSNDDVVKALAEVGLLGLTLPHRYGGMGRDYAALGVVCEELGAVDTAHQVSFTVHLALTSACILQWGTEEQRQSWLPRLAHGEEIGTFGLTEPDAGSDVGALRMQARQVEGGFVLNGEKSWISAANQASVYIIFASVDLARRHKGITAFVVPADAPGVSSTVLHGKLGLHSGDTGTVVCNGVFVPDEAVLGNIGEGFVVALSTLGNGLFTVGCGALGIARACREWTVEFLREVGADSQLDLGLLANMVAREQASRLLLVRAAELKNAGLPNAQQTGVAKWRASSAAVENARDALEIWSRHSAGEHPTLLRHAFNAKATVIYGGTSEIHTSMQGAYALGYRIERPFRRPSPTAADLA